MQLHWSPRSPFVRKVTVFAIETGLDGRIERVASPVAITEPNPALMRFNPLNKLPTLVLDDGSALFDSLVICAYLDTLHDGPPLLPMADAPYLATLRWHAMTDGLLDMLILWRNERERGQPSQAHLDAYAVKAQAVLTRLEEEVGTLEATPFDLAHITLGCTLSYVDFRFDDLGWRTGRPGLAAFSQAFDARPSAQATVPTLAG